MAIKAHGGLGKGLGALLQDNATADRETVREITVSEIQANRYQPREDFDESALEELAESVRVYGILQPIVVRQLPSGGYELVAGERRLRAARQAGLETIPAAVREFNDAQMSEIALVENLQREDLNIMEEARACARLLSEFGHTQETLAKSIGRSRSHIANILRLQNLAPEVQGYLANGSLSMGQAKPLLALESHELQCKAADIIQSEGLSSRQSEALVKRMLQEDAPASEGKSSDQKEQAIYIQEATDRLTELLGTQVRIVSGKKKSRIQIEFYSEDDLSRIVESLTMASIRDKQRKIDALRKASLAQNFNV